MSKMRAVVEYNVQSGKKAQSNTILRLVKDVMCFDLMKVVELFPWFKLKL